MDSLARDGYRRRIASAGSDLGQGEPGDHLPIWQEALFGIEILLLHAAPVYFGFGVPRGETGTPAMARTFGCFALVPFRFTMIADADYGAVDFPVGTMRVNDNVIFGAMLIGNVTPSVAGVYRLIVTRRRAVGAIS